MKNRLETGQSLIKYWHTAAAAIRSLFSQAIALGRVAGNLDFCSQHSVDFLYLDETAVRFCATIRTATHEHYNFCRREVVRLGPQTSGLSSQSISIDPSNS